MDRAEEASPSSSQEPEGRASSRGAELRPGDQIQVLASSLDGVWQLLSLWVVKRPVRTNLLLTHVDAVSECGDIKQVPLQALLDLDNPEALDSAQLSKLVQHALQMPVFCTIFAERQAAKKWLEQNHIRMSADDSLVPAGWDTPAAGAEPTVGVLRLTLDLPGGVFGAEVVPGWPCCPSEPTPVSKLDLIFTPLIFSSLHSRDRVAFTPQGCAVLVLASDGVVSPENAGSVTWSVPSSGWRYDFEPGAKPCTFDADEVRVAWDLQICQSLQADEERLSKTAVVKLLLAPQTSLGPAYFDRDVSG